MASEIKVNKISPGSGTALQISDSGDTVTLPSGATLTIAGTINASTGTATGFGDNLDWQTSDIKTSTFTEVADKGYFFEPSNCPPCGELLATSSILFSHSSSSFSISA